MKFSAVKIVQRNKIHRHYGLFDRWFTYDLATGVFATVVRKVTRGKSFANSALLCIPVEKFHDYNNALMIQVVFKIYQRKSFATMNSRNSWNFFPGVTFPTTALIRQVLTPLQEVRLHAAWVVSSLLPSLPSWAISSCAGRYQTAGTCLLRHDLKTAWVD